MFGTYLRRELVNRRKQTIIIALGMALAIGLVIVVNSISAGVTNAQAAVLQSVYGVGTDVTISQAPAAPAAGGSNRPKFNFGAADGAAAGGTRTVNQSRLVSNPSVTLLDSSVLTTVAGVTGVAASTGTLSLNNVSFNGTIPDAAGQSAQRVRPTAPSGGADGAGGSSFNVNSFTVLGLDSSGASVGPLSSVALGTGRLLTPADAGKDVAVLDASYATSATLAVGGTVNIGGTDFQIVGTVVPTGSDSATSSNVYIPLDVAQALSTNTGKLTNIYVQASSSDQVTALASSLKTALPAATVSTQADLASSVSGSLGTAATLVSSLGTWLSIIVLAAAFLIAILFTVSGVTRRTREFGTLKAIGWSNGSIVRQVAGESVVQGLIGGVIGIAIGLIGITVINIIAPTLSGSAGVAAAAGRGAGGFGGAGGGGGFGAGGGPGGGGFGGIARAAQNVVTLQAPVTISIILIAVGLAVLGGLVAGAFGGWRAAKLRPAEALRSVA